MRTGPAESNALVGAELTTKILPTTSSTTGVEFIKTDRGLFRHVGASRLTATDLPHGGRVARCGEYVTIRCPSSGPRPYDGHRLRIVAVNHESFPDSTRRPRPLDYVEVAVAYGSRTLWFRLDELRVSP